MLPGDVKPPEGGTERRRQRAPRAPSMRTLVKLAMQCDSAEQLGERLRRRRAEGDCSPRSSIGCWCRIDAASQRPRNNHRQRHHNRDQSEKITASPI